MLNAGRGTDSSAVDCFAGQWGPPTKTESPITPLSIDQATEDDEAVLARLRSCLPVLADLARGDVFVFRTTDNPVKLKVDSLDIAQTVPSIGAGLSQGDFVSHDDEPAIARTLARGTYSHNAHKLRPHNRPSIQDIYPIRNGPNVIAALVVEISQVENGRWERRNVVYRRAIDRFRRLVVAGRMSGAASLSRLTDHDGAMVVTGTGQIVYISSLAEQLYRRAGYTHSLLHFNIDKLGTDETTFEAAVASGECVEHLVGEGPYTWLKRAIPLDGDDSERIWNRVLSRAEPSPTVILTVHDVTDEARKERELKVKSAMIQEIHHRVKNNLQTIAALLRLQARRTGSAEVSEILKESIDRILSIAVVHEFLAHQESNDVEVRAIAQQIIHEVTRSLLDPEKRIRFNLDAERFSLPTQQATSFALVINELLHNTVEHAFAAMAEGSVQIRLTQSADRIVLEVVDDGAGLPFGFDVRQTHGLGLQIVQTLVREDLKGTFQLVPAEDRGVKGIVTFPRAQ